MIEHLSKLKIYLIVALIFVAGLCFSLPCSISASAASTDITRYAYQYVSGSDKVYDLLALYEITEVKSDSDVYVSADGETYSKVALPTVARYVKSASACTIYVNKLPTATVKSADINLGCYVNQGPEKIYDGRDNNYMATTSNDAFLLDIELDDYYELTGFRWYSYLEFCPVGSISVSLNGTDFIKWADFDFANNFITDPYLQNQQSYLMTEYSTVKCKYVRIETTTQKQVATREVTFYGEKYVPDVVDPEGITINQKNADGAYNTKETAFNVGDTFSLSATYTNKESIAKTVWESESPNMLEVDNFGGVKVLRGGSAEYYVIKASVSAPDGTIYSDSIKIYVKGIVNISGIADISWHGVAHFYGAPAKAFDNINGNWGNWMQATDGTVEYSVTCDFNQEIRFGKIAVHVGVNAPMSITVKGVDGSGNLSDIQFFDNLSANKSYAIEDAGTYSEIVFVIKENSLPSTIYEIEIFNHESFALSDIKGVELPEERGPGSQMEYVPQKDTTASLTNEYDKKYSSEKQTGMFKYSHFNPVYVIAIVLGIGGIGVVILTVISFTKKERKK